MRAWEPDYPRVRTLRRRARSWILARDGHRCICGAVATSMDHIWPWAHGGSDHSENLRALCRRCNSIKRDSLPGTLPFYLRRPRDPGDVVLGGMAADRASAWAAIAERLHDLIREHIRIEGDSVDCDWVRAMHRKRAVANERVEHWVKVNQSHFRRAAVESRQLEWALTLPH